MKIALWTKHWALQTGLNFKFYTSITSTNTQAKKAPPAQPAPQLFIAASQTKGRGRLGRAWQNSDMMLSLKYTLFSPPKTTASYLMGQALCQALKAVWPDVPFAVKKPNDILIHHKKAGGILIEVVSLADVHHFIIGAGLNVFKAPPGFACLTNALNKPVLKKDWFLFLSLWLKEITNTLPLCVSKQL